MTKKLQQAKNVSIDMLLRFLSESGACSERFVIRPFETPQDAWEKLPWGPMHWWLGHTGAGHKDAIVALVNHVHREIRAMVRARGRDRYDYRDEIFAGICRAVYPSWEDAWEDGHGFENRHSLARQNLQASALGQTHREAKRMDRLRRIDQAIYDEWWKLTLGERTILRRSLQGPDGTDNGRRFAIKNAIVDNTRLTADRSVRRWLKQAVAVGAFAEFAQKHAFA